MGVIWGIIAAAIVLTIIVIVVTHFVTKKGSSRSRVGVSGQDTQPPTVNNSAIPQESEVDVLDDVKRATRKDTER